MSLSAEERGGPAISLFTPTDKEMRFLVEHYSFILFRLVLLSSQSRGLVIPLIIFRDNHHSISTYSSLFSFNQCETLILLNIFVLYGLWIIEVFFAEQYSFIQFALQYEYGTWKKSNILWFCIRYTCITTILWTLISTYSRKRNGYKKEENVVFGSRLFGPSTLSSVSWDSDNVSPISIYHATAQSLVFFPLFLTCSFLSCSLY